MKRNDIRKQFFKGAKVTVAEITRKAVHLGFTDAADADYTDGEAYRIAEVLREELARVDQKPSKLKRSQVPTLPFPTFRQAGNAQFDYFLKLIELLKQRFNDDLNEFEKTVLNNPDKAAELAKEIDRLLQKIESGDTHSWTITGVDKPRFDASLTDIYPARLANVLKKCL